jgi:hypothetical protein
MIKYHNGNVDDCKSLNKGSNPFLILKYRLIVKVLQYFLYSINLIIFFF